MKILGIVGSSRKEGISGVHQLVKTTEDMIPRVTKQPEVMEAAADAGKQLGERLRNGHDRKTVTQKMQKTLMKMFAESA
jgi:limonene-1,2-epoxide hydrolase